VRYAAGDSEKPNQVPRGGGVRSQPTGYGGSWLSGWPATLKAAFPQVNGHL